MGGRGGRLTTVDVMVLWTASEWKRGEMLRCEHGKWSEQRAEEEEGLITQIVLALCHTSLVLGLHLYDRIMRQGTLNRDRRGWGRGEDESSQPANQPTAEYHNEYDTQPLRLMPGRF